MLVRYARGFHVLINHLHVSEPDNVAAPFQDPTTNKVVDFVSFYSLPSTVIGHPVHKHINAAYLFYYVPRDMGADPKILEALLKDGLILARNVS